mgnify:CR=1 FL=1
MIIIHHLTKLWSSNVHCDISVVEDNLAGTIAPLRSWM